MKKLFIFISFAFFTLNQASDTGPLSPRTTELLCNNFIPKREIYQSIGVQCHLNAANNDLAIVFLCETPTGQRSAVTAMPDVLKSTLGLDKYIETVIKIIKTKKSKGQ